VISAERSIVELTAITAELVATLGAALSLYDDVIVALFALHSLSPSFSVANSLHSLQVFCPLITSNTSSLKSPHQAQL